jgi:hypothetical protein
MGPGILIPVLLVAVVVPIGVTWAHRRFKSPGEREDEPASAPAARLTSNALRALPAPPWRVVYEINPDRLGGVEHVVIGPPGIFAVVTSMDPMPSADDVDSDAVPDAHAIAQAAILRGALDDALRRCAMTSDRLVTVHWGANAAGQPSVELLPGATAVDGRQIEQWGAALAADLDGRALTPAQVDLAWQTTATAIGRPDPLA